jgi:hypothetical protein
MNGSPERRAIGFWFHVSEAPLFGRVLHSTKMILNLYAENRKIARK